jgi:ABC-type transport system involved in multi-copper enzyme maturation permease subunit
MSFIETVEPFVVMYVMLGLATIVIPATLHGTIAGEREQRALDMLLVAPVTPGQIIVGKFARAFLTVGMLVVFIGIPAFFIELVKQTDTQYRYMQGNGFVGYLVSLLLVVATSLMIGALTMWISSKTKTKTGAMLGTIGAMFVLFLVVPIMGGAMSFVFPQGAELLLNTSPFTLLYHAYMGIPDESTYGNPYYYGMEVVHPATYVWPTIFALLLLAVLFLTLATTNLQKIALGRTE